VAAFTKNTRRDVKKRTDKQLEDQLGRDEMCANCFVLENNLAGGKQLMKRSSSQLLQLPMSTEALEGAQETLQEVVPSYLGTLNDIEY
jgi:hypothetical protein